MQDKDFLKPLLHKMHVNPPAEVSTSMKVSLQSENNTEYTISNPNVKYVWLDLVKYRRITMKIRTS